VHVTLRSAFRPLRSKSVFPTIGLAISELNERAPKRFRVVHFSVQFDHIHCIVEAADARSLSAGMRGLSISIARRVNALVGRRGRFWADRWHGRALGSPSAVRAALAYVLGHFREHSRNTRSSIDPYSSAPDFAGFRELEGRTPREAVDAGRRGGLTLPHKFEPSAVLAPRTWLLKKGWRRQGPLSALAMPAAALQLER
jgi:REP element-mobilizing transposase RayT